MTALCDLPIGGRVLNAQASTSVQDTTSLISSESVKSIGYTLVKEMLQLKVEFISADGQAVDYQGMKGSNTFIGFCRTAQLLGGIDLDDMSNVELKALFINIYNALTLHAIATATDIPTSVLDINKFWRTNLYSIGNNLYSLDDIEHGILRGNQRHPLGDVMFSSDDKRLHYSIKDVDPRIHFALVCGAKSCPPIAIFTSEKLDKELDLAARCFISQECLVDDKSRVVTLSRLFQWYKDDFGKTEEEMLRWISKYLKSDQQQSLITWLDEKVQFEVKFSEYNWKLNGKL